MLPQRTQVSFPVVTGTSRFLSSYCSGNSPHLYLCPETPCSSPVATGIPGLPQGSPGSQACSRVESKQSAVLSHCDGYLLDTCEWPKGSPASYGVWRGNSGLFSRPCRNLVVFLELQREVSGFSRVMMGNSGSLSCCPREVQSPFELQGGERDCSRVTAWESGLNLR